MVVSLWAFVRFFLTWSPFFYTAFNWIRELFQRRGSDARRRRSQTFQIKMRSRAHFAVVISTLADFQKAQAIFWTAINVATIFAALIPSKVLGATSFGVFATNIIFMKAIVKASFFFTFFGLYTLHIASQRSWYIFSLSLCAIISAGIAYYAVDNPNLNEISTEARALQSCGNINPTVYCSAIVSRPGGNWTTPALMVPILTMTGVLLIQMFLYNTGLFGRNIKNETGYRRSFATLRDKKWGRILAAILVFLWEAYIFFAWLILYVTLVNDFVFHRKNPDTGNMAWGFGQILALTVWFPIILEYLYAWLCKV